MCVPAALGRDGARPAACLYASTAEAAWASFEEFDSKWGSHYPAIGKVWRSKWTEFVPFLGWGACRRMLLRVSGVVRFECGMG